jgi:hypothetical protein
VPGGRSPVGNRNALPGVTALCARDGCWFSRPDDADCWLRRPAWTGHRNAPWPESPSQLRAAGDPPDFQWEDQIFPLPRRADRRDRAAQTGPTIPATVAQGGCPGLLVNDPPVLGGHPIRRLIRSDDLVNLRRGRRQLRTDWAATVAGMRQSPGIEHERVNDEWSAVQTQRGTRRPPGVSGSLDSSTPHREVFTRLRVRSIRHSASTNVPGHHI